MSNENSDVYEILKTIARGFNVGLLSPTPDFGIDIRCLPGEEFDATVSVRVATSEEEPRIWQGDVVIPLMNEGTYPDGRQRVSVAPRPFMVELYRTRYLVCVGDAGTVWHTRFPICCSSWTMVMPNGNIMSEPFNFVDDPDIPVHPGKVLHTI